MKDLFFPVLLERECREIVKLLPVRGGGIIWRKARDAMYEYG